MSSTGVLDARLDGRLGELEAAVGAALPGGRLGVAFSAGVDSTVLLALAARALGTGRVLAITGDSPSLARRELGEARGLAALIGVELAEIPTAEGSSPDYRRNGLDRCFHCKDTLFQTIDDAVLRRHGLDAVAYGETADDVQRDDRPGSTAATRHGVLRPLAAAGLRKPDIRALAAALGLPNAAKPAAPCLASRIPHGTEVTPEKLRQVEQAEAALADLGLPDLRVRHHGALARLEVPTDRIAEVATAPLRDQVLGVVRAAGFTMVTVDLGGLRSGGLFQIARQIPSSSPTRTEHR
jgi:uncharacterized protein